MTGSRYKKACRQHGGRTIASRDALAAAIHFQIQHAVQSEQDLEMLVGMAAVRGAVAPDRQGIGRVFHVQALVAPALSALCACWSAWYELRTIAPTAAWVKPIS